MTRVVIDVAFFFDRTFPTGRGPEVDLASHFRLFFLPQLFRLPPLPFLDPSSLFLAFTLGQLTAGCFGEPHMEQMCFPCPPEHVVPWQVPKL